MTATRGILGWGTYLPYRRLDLATVAAVAGSGGRAGHRTVASYDEDSTTLAAEAARFALQGNATAVTIGDLWFATTSPAYQDKTNATAIHASLGLPEDGGAYDAVGSVRSAAGALRGALGSRAAALVVAGDLRTGLPGGPDEAAGGDAGSALLVGSAADGLLLADLVGRASRSAELLDRWRAPGAARSKLWEERFAEPRYVELGTRAWEAALAEAELAEEAVDHVVVVGPHDRAITRLRAALAKRSGGEPVALEPAIGNTGAAHPALALAAALEQASPGQVLALVVVADGADAFLFRATDALADHRPWRTVRQQVEAGGPLAYGKYLAWRGLLPVEPPRRPEPLRPSASAAARRTGWKFGFVGSERGGGPLHLPPSALDERPRPMAAATGTVATFTVDRLAYSPSPPVVFAVVDFDGGGRLPMEITDVDPDDLAIGMEVEMTFRRLFTADDVHNYFWKARPRRTSGAPAGP